MAWASRVDVVALVQVGVQVALGTLFAASASAQSAGSADARANLFNDPFVQVTSGVASCPTPEGPGVTESERRAQSHGRIERGTSCFQTGRCRLPNSYLYDAEIVPRAKKAIEVDGHFGDTSVWLEGQRRWVYLKGCVYRQADADAIEQRVRGLDDVEAVVNELKVVPSP